MRIQELHPVSVHLPLTLYPIALGADAIGKVSGDRRLLDIGRWGIILSMGGTVSSAITGAVAQETLDIDEDVQEILVAHRNLNISFLGLVTLLAIERARRESPSTSYLALGAVGMGALMYSAYLGGHMVYEHGVGVKAAGKLREEKAPAIRPGNIPQVSRVLIKNLIDGVRNTCISLANKPFLPNWKNTDGKGHEEVSHSAREVRPENKMNAAEDDISQQ